MTRNTRTIGALALLAGLGAPALAAALGGRIAQGTLQGWTTVAHAHFNQAQGTTVCYDISGSGSGSNVLTVKLQQKKDGLGWKTLVTKKLDMPSDSASGSCVVEDLLSGNTEELRWRFSRDIGTQEIDFEVIF